MALDYSFKSTGLTQALLDAYQKKVAQEEQIRMDNEKIKQQKIENVRQLFQDGAKAVSSLVEQSKTKEREDAFKAYTDLLAKRNERVVEPNAEPIKVKTSLAPGGVASAAPTTEYGSTPEFSTLSEAYLAKANPTEYQKQKIEQMFSEKTQQLPELKYEKVWANLDGKPQMLNYGSNGRWYDQNLNPVFGRVEQIAPPSAFADVREEMLRQKQAETLGKDLNELGINSNSPAGISAKRVLYSKSGLTLLEQARNQPGGADKRQMAELQMEIARVLTGQGVITNEQLNNLATATAKTRVKNWEEWLTNRPTGLGQAAFMDRFEETLNRQLKFHTGELDKYKLKSMAKHRAFERQAPDEFDATLKQAGFDPEVYRKKRILVPLDGEQMAPEFVREQPGGVPQVGQMYDGKRIIKVKRIR